MITKLEIMDPSGHSTKTAEELGSAELLKLVEEFRRRGYAIYNESEAPPTLIFQGDKIPETAEHLLVVPPYQGG